MSNLSPDLFYNRLKRLKMKIKCFWPEKLPTTKEEMDRLIDEVLFTADIPSEPLYEHAIASAIMHLGPVTHRKARRYFCKSIRKQIANEKAFEKIQEIKAIEKQKQEATLVKETMDGSEPKDSSSSLVQNT